MDIKLKGSQNTRYIKPFNSILGGHVKGNTFIRSGKLGKVKKKNLNKFISEHNVKTVIDLRTPVEIKEEGLINYPNEVNYLQIPILNQAFFGITHEKHMSRVMFKERKKINKNFTSDNYVESMYESMLMEDSSKLEFQKIMDVILNHDNGSIVYHCSSGKDRTGMVTLFILSLLGVDENEIIDDYVLSDYYNKRYNGIRILGLHLFLYVPRMKKLLISMLKAKREYIEHTISFLKEKYGSVIDYMKTELNFTEEKIAQFRTKFLVQ